MSYKIQAFTSVIGSPLTKRDMTLLWPALPQSMVVVQGFVFPTESVRTVTVPWRGVGMEVPTSVYEPGDWEFEVPDNIYTTVRYEILDAYLRQSVHSIGLVLGNVTNVLNFTSWSGVIGDILNAGGVMTSALRTAVVLEGAFIKGIDSVQYTGTSGAVDAILWRVKVHYSYIRMLTDKG